MSRVYNFSAGPAILPEPVLRQAAEEMLEWHDAGSSVMEMSHRGKAFMSIAAAAEADLRELLAIPDNYKVLFLQGGATGMFSAIPQNLTAAGASADYVLTGAWSKKAAKEAGKFLNVNIAASGEAHNFFGVPPQSEWQLSKDAAYVHYCPNETISGVAIDQIPDTGDVPLVADFSSTILSRPIDVSRFGLIYAGAQKNIGPAGLVLVIVREDLIGKARPETPMVWDFAQMAAADSMLNTPPCYSWYICGLVFKWLKAQGGLEKMAAINQRKADKLYSAIDNSNGFYTNPIEKSARSWMNVPFVLANADLDASFLSEAQAQGLHTLKGHRSVGGMRASLYNAMPEAGVSKLIEFMHAFAERHG